MPLQHEFSILPDGRQTVTRILRSGLEGLNHPIRGLCELSLLSLERSIVQASLASASGRRAQANRCLYQPSSWAIATPYSEEWMNQPFPR